MAKVTIIETATGEVMETGKEVGELKDWNYYWTVQCATDRYHYVVEEA